MATHQVNQLQQPLSGSVLIVLKPVPRLHDQKACTKEDIAAAAAFVLSLAISLACWLPALRAAKVDPMVALRSE